MFWLFLIVAALAFALPNAFKYLIAAPVFGCCVGGLVWGIVLMTGNADALSLRVGAAFMVGGTVIAELFALWID